MDLPAAALPLATVRESVAEFLSTVIYVYIVVIFAYIVTNLLFAAGLRPPYTRTGNAILGYLRDVCEPYLRIFRRLLPSFGGFDFSPIIAIFALEIVNQIVIKGILY